MSEKKMKESRRVKNDTIWVKEPPACFGGGGMLPKCPKGGN